MPQYPFQSIESYDPDRLIAGETHLDTRSFILAAGQVINRGTLLGQVTASGKLLVSTTAATDGSQLPFGIAIDYYDSTAGDLAGCGVYLKGDFNENAVTFGAGWTALNAFGPMRAVGLYLKPSVAVSGQYA